MDRVVIKEENQSIGRTLEKCIHCGTCLTTCKKNNNLALGDCINCGACILTCPVGAITPKYCYKELRANLHDEEKIVIVSVSPAVRVAIGDEFGFAPGEFLESRLVGALKALGFAYVFDTTFSADLTIMEEASELVNRIQNKNLPMFTSCCPSWVLYMEKYHSEDLGHLSTCKSPISMQGSIIKNYFATLKNFNKEDIVTVSLTPCVSKKSEIKREELDCNDYVITTSELAMLIRESGIDFKTVKPGVFDSILGSGSGAGLIFGTSGGVLESALRTAYYLINHEKAPDDFFHLTSVRGLDFLKETSVSMGVKTLKVLVVYGIHNVSKLYNQLKQYDFVEVMTCAGGCIGGGGQPLIPQNKMAETLKKRSESLYQHDALKVVRASYENREIKRIYRDFLEYPGSFKSKKLLHTTYQEKSALKTIIK